MKYSLERQRRRASCGNELRRCAMHIEGVWSEPEPTGVGKRRNSVDEVEGVCNIPYKNMVYLERDVGDAM